MKYKNGEFIIPKDQVIFVITGIVIGFLSVSTVIDNLLNSFF